VIIYRSEASASLRRVPLWLVGSNGTSPATAEAGGQPQVTWYGRPAATANTTATLSLISANAGEYYVELAASEVSALGMFSVQYRSANAIPNSTYGQIVNFDSGDSTRLGLVSLPTAAAEAAGGLITRGTGTGQLQVSAGSVGLLAQTHSGATVAGLTSGVTLFANTHSGATIQGVTRVNSSVTVADALYSSVTVRVDPVAYSGLTVGVANIAAGSYSGVSVEVTNLVQSVRSQIADDFLLRDVASGAHGGRSVQDALRTLRNRVQIDGSTMTVYTEDDVTSAWTASVSTVADVVVSGINPGGP